MKKIIVLFVFLFNLMLFGIAFGAISYILSPVSPQTAPTQTVVIPKGAGVSAIGTLLQQKNLIRSAWAFRFVVWKNKTVKNLQAGQFDLSPSQSPEEIAQALTKGTDDVWVTIVEGLRNEEIAEVLAQNLGSTFDSKEFLQLANGKQGFLFPDTYLVPKMVTARTMVNLMQTTFTKKTTTGIQDELQKKNRSFVEAVILASLIQREARTPETMKMIAGILLRRLEKGWPLQVDATLQYSKGYDPKEKTWWPTPYAEDKKLKSLYNTYAHPGLPPAPIANPGLHALEAATNPTSSDYWYYITDDAGVMHYAKTVEEHNANVKKYLR
ncbi:MAG: endolytic transglycosylase MltG [Candidatus Pacebacteria bacterium]|nr:endolytic transglycosylase MltG [Candidatus Paceibacterota bacterium]